MSKLFCGRMILRRLPLALDTIFVKRLWIKGQVDATKVLHALRVEIWEGHAWDSTESQLKRLAFKGCTYVVLPSLSESNTDLQRCFLVSRAWYRNVLMVGFHFAVWLLVLSSAFNVSDFCTFLQSIPILTCVCARKAMSAFNIILLVRSVG